MDISDKLGQLLNIDGVFPENFFVCNKMIKTKYDTVGTVTKNHRKRQNRYP
jgi:hypothetical protein